MTSVNGSDKTLKVFKVIGYVIVIAYFLWNFIDDRFSLGAQVQKNAEEIQDMKRLERSVRIIEYNLEKMIVKDGGEWKVPEYLRDIK